jgi:hypothetical protein
MRGFNKKGALQFSSESLVLSSVTHALLVVAITAIYCRFIFGKGTEHMNASQARPY